jgi:hypothetical protein
MTEITERQQFVLNWLQHNPQSRSRWMRNGKEAYGHPTTWDAIEISGKQGSIVIAESDWRAISDLIKHADFNSDQMFVPRAALATAQDKQG